MKVSNRSFKKTQNKEFNSVLIKNLSEYLNYISFLVDKWEETELWFRGVSNVSYELIPTIFRKNAWEHDADSELEIIDTFIHRAKGYSVNQNFLTWWEWYQTMQHYGLPTRLLDWTEGCLIGLYFAIRESNKDATPAVWVLNPYSLNENSNKSYTIYYTDPLTQDLEDKIVDKYRFHYTKLPKYPISILPPYINERMTAQKSCFTIHGKLLNGFEKAFQRNKGLQLVQLVFDGSSKNLKKLKDELVQSGITEATIFPDLEGLAREIKYLYNIK